MEPLKNDATRVATRQYLPAMEMTPEMEALLKQEGAKKFQEQAKQQQGKLTDLGGKTRREIGRGT